MVYNGILLIMTVCQLLFFFIFYAHLSFLDVSFPLSLDSFTSKPISVPKPKEWSWTWVCQPIFHATLADMGLSLGSQSCPSQYSLYTLLKKISFCRLSTTLWGFSTVFLSAFLFICMFWGFCVSVCVCERERGFVYICFSNRQVGDLARGTFLSTEWNLATGTCISPCRHVIYPPKLEGLRGVRCRRMKRCMFLLNLGQLSCLKNVFHVFCVKLREIMGNEHTLNRVKSIVLWKISQDLLGVICKYSFCPVQMYISFFVLFCFFLYFFGRLQYTLS